MDMLRKNIIIKYEQRGVRWLASLPHLVRIAQVKYGLSSLTAYTGLTHNYCLAGLQGEQPIVLKFSIDSEGLDREAHALQSFAGHGAVRVLARDEGVLLLEQVLPGTSLKSFFPERDEQAVFIVVQVMKRLHAVSFSKTQQFSHLADVLAVLDEDHAIAREYLRQARKLRDDLVNTSTEEVLLHGDLHHGNILRAGDEWVVIDPQGVRGERVCEVAAFVCNPLPDLLAHEDARTLIAQRIALFAQLLQVSEQRLLRWCFVLTVLRWVWALEDNCPDEYFGKMAKILHEMNAQT